MEERARQTGSDVIGAVPWGTHLCLFYETERELLDILVPYFKTGLENNEFCIWVTSEPLNGKEAGEAMGKAIPSFNQYLERGQIEIVPHTEWYLKGGDFDAQRVLNAWINKLDQSLAKAYDGTRISGNIAWLGEENWEDFTDYEEKLNTVIGDNHMLVICTYLLDTCGVAKAIDVMRNHPFALIKRAGEWVLVSPRERQETTPRVKSRKRVTALQESFTRSGFEGLSDQETLELLFSLVSPYQGYRKLAKECVERFGDLSGFLAASPQELERVGLTPRSIFSIKVLRELPAEVLKKKIIEQPFYKSSHEVFDYLYYSMRDLKKEVFKAIYLNSRNQIIDTEDLFEGTLESIPIRPREIVEKAIKHGSAAVIFVHNHPSGDTTPSRGDKQITRDLVFIGNIIQIKVLDHIIIGGNKYFSFADEGLIEKYKDNFLNLKIRGVFDSGASYR